MDAGILVPISFFAMIAAIALAPRYLKSVERQKLLEALKLAIEKGQPVPAEVISAISAQERKAPPSPDRDLRRGIVWLGVAVGLAVFGLVVGFEEPDATYPILAFAAFPGFIGLAFLAIAFLARGRS
jgi:hypothetical protein